MLQKRKFEIRYFLLCKCLIYIVVIKTVQVVVEWPQRVIKNEKFHFRTPSTKSEIALAKEDASGYLAR